jgi:hypothetical protein
MAGRAKCPIDWPDDFYVLYSTSSGYISATDLRDSPFIKVLGDSLIKNHREMSVQDIFQDVKKDVSKKTTNIRDPVSGVIVASMQVPDDCSTLTKQLYLSKSNQTKSCLFLPF